MDSRTLDLSTFIDEQLALVECFCVQQLLQPHEGTRHAGFGLHNWFDERRDRVLESVKLAEPFAEVHTAWLALCACIERATDEQLRLASLSSECAALCKRALDAAGWALAERALGTARAGHAKDAHGRKFVAMRIDMRWHGRKLVLGVLGPLVKHNGEPGRQQSGLWLALSPAMPAHARAFRARLQALAPAALVKSLAAGWAVPGAVRPVLAAERDAADTADCHVQPRAGEAFGPAEEVLR